MPVADRLAQSLSGAGLQVINRCNSAKVDIHSSYRKAALKRYQVNNLGTAMGLRKVLWGKIQMVQRKKNELLNLEHVRAQIELSLMNPQNEQTIGQIKLEAHGFHRDLSAARTLAGESLIARFLLSMSQLLKPKMAPLSRPVLEVHVEGLVRLGDLDNLIAGLSELDAISSVSVSRLARRTAVLDIKPSSVVGPLLLYLRTQPFTALVKQPGKADIRVEAAKAEEEIVAPEAETEPADR
jgi:hypothetical protein